jgi:hypothetical protein
MVQFDSREALAEELPRARKEYVQRTGDLFETDDNFESRIACFLEWYVFDRQVSAMANKTPARLYIESVTAGLTTPEVNRLRDLTRTVLSLFEFRRARESTLAVVDLLAGTKHEIFERRKPAGLEPGDILEARLVPFEEHVYFSEAFAFHPRPARKAILKAAKLFRKTGRPEQRLDLVHRVAFLGNRCRRYKHVDPAKIFADLLADKPSAAPLT